MTERPEPEVDSRRAHWDAVYECANIEGLGWFEEVPKHSMQMIDRVDPGRGDLILDVGSGASTLIPHLLRRGHARIAAVDFSEIALARARSRLSERDRQSVMWVVDDILRPERLLGFEGMVDVWHDRAVFHFLTEESDRALYGRTLRRLVREGGHVIIATFFLTGADRCSGLPVRRYDAAMIGACIGPEFDLLSSFECEYIMPSGGRRPYVYTLFRRTSFNRTDEESA